MSTSPVNKLYLRKWQLVITAPASGGTQQILTLPDPSQPNQESLRVTFDVQTSWWSAPWYADISIYNLNEQTANFLLSQGTNSTSSGSPTSGTQGLQIAQNMQVTLSAGYQNGRYGVIWSGPVLQPLWEREGQTDFKLTLHCMNWLSIVGRNDVSQVFAAGANQQQIVQSIAKNSYHPIGVGSISSTLANKTLPRGKVVFGNPKKYLHEISRDNNFQWWIEGNGKLNVAGLNDKSVPISTANPIKYTPTTGIIGTPEQTQYGCNFRLLLDPSVNVRVPAITVNIDNTQIRQQLKQAGVYPGLLAQDGTYVVVGARFTGDTRGQNWYTDVTGYNMAAQALAALAAATGVQLGPG
jgi:hypothetical protein